MDVLFAGIAVADFKAAFGWYGRLFGRSADVVVKDDEVMWRIADAAWLYVVADAGRAGHGLVTISVADLDDAITDIEGRGLRSEAVETIAGAGRKASIADPDGNRIALIEVVRPDH
jgi:predicted enzyme related to lactoylglutathione lyase